MLAGPRERFERMAKRPLRTIGAIVCLSATLAFPAASAHEKGAKVAPAASVIGNFSLLADAPVKKCAAAPEKAIAADGWRAEPMLCSWQGRLQMRRWQSIANPGEARCVSTQAAWWSAMRSAAGDRPAVWQSAWNAQVFSDQLGPRKRIFVLKKTPGGAWQAAEWTWQPAPALKTRKWEARRWSSLEKETKGLAASPGKVAFDAADTLMQDWTGRLNGRPAEMSAASWQWQDGSACLRMEEAALEKAQLHLPYSKEDVRLEQRSAMQLGLARANPQAKWLIPFQVLPASKKSTSQGTQYEAVWAEGPLVRGQLWIPQKNGGSVLRLRIAASAPAGDAGKVQSRLKDLVHQELSGLATAWSANHDR